MGPLSLQKCKFKGIIYFWNVAKWPGWASDREHGLAGVSNFNVLLVQQPEATVTVRHLKPGHCPTLFKGFIWCILPQTDKFTPLTFEQFWALHTVFWSFEAGIVPYSFQGIHSLHQGVSATNAFTAIQSCAPHIFEQFWTLHEHAIVRATTEIELSRE